MMRILNRNSDFIELIGRIEVMRDDREREKEKDRGKKDNFAGYKRTY